jgi:hypothetical protein
MFLAFRAMRMIQRVICPIRFGAPMVLTNNYLHIYNLNHLYLNLLLDSAEEEEEAM